MDADDVKKTIKNILKLRESADKIIESLELILDRKDDALNSLLSSRRVNKIYLDQLRDEVKVEYRYLRFIAHFIGKAMEDVKLIIGILESGNKEITDTELGREVVKRNLEFYQTVLEELEEGHRIIEFFREHAQKEQEFLRDAKNTINSKEFGENFQKFWAEIKDEFRANVEVTRLQNLKDQAESLVNETANLNKKFYKFNVGRMVLGSSPILLILGTYGFMAVTTGKTNPLIWGVMGIGVGLYALAGHLLKKKNINIFHPY